MTQNNAGRQLAVWLVVLLPAAAPAGPMTAVDPRRVTVGGEIGRRIDITIRKNLLAIDVEEDFLRPFREKNRWPFSYVGLGKQIDAVVRLAYHTGDKRLVALKDHLVAETIKTQLADGYIGIFAGGRMGVWWDLHEASYVLFGLVSDYRHFGSKASLAAARKLADYMIKRRPARPMVVHVSTIGLERAFVALHEATKDTKYLDHVTKDDSLQNWHGGIGGHAYDFMNVCMAQLDVHRIRPDEKLLRQSRRVVDFLTAADGLVIGGTCSLSEGWHGSQVGTGKLGETCCTAYLIRLLDNLLRIEGKSLYGDIMERAIFNALPAAQSPDGRELRKYTPFDGPRTYYRGEKSSAFKRDTYCCPNNFRRIVAELPNMIYYRSGRGVAVNLYTQSQATIDLADGLSVKLRQETDYPNTGKVIVHVSPSKPARFPLRLRIPRWCRDAWVGGEAVQGGQFFALERKWSAGDRVAVELPMPWRLVRGRKAQRGRLAILRGPQVFCLNPMRQAERHPAFGGRRGARGVALAKIREKLDRNIAATGLLDGAGVDLADIVGGGGGFGSGKVGRGISPRDGKPTTGSAQRVPCGPNVFVPDGGKDATASTPITSTGIKISGVPDTCVQTWDHFKHGPALSQRGFKVGDVDYRARGHSMLAIHANKLITFDLAAIRKATGYGGLRLKTVVGYGGAAAEATVNFSVYLDGRAVVESTRISRSGLPLDLPIAPDMRFLTLMVTDGNNDISHDQIFFGDPKLVPAPRPKKPNAAAARRRLLAERDALQKRIAAYPAIADVLKGLRLDATSLTGPVQDDTVRPGGLACRARAWSGGRDGEQRPDLTLLLTEFADPGGEATYFVFSPSDAETVDDELCRPAKR